MKNIHIITFAITLLFLGACNDEFLDRTPETSIGKENFFNSEADLNLYINGLYAFPGWPMFISDLATDNASTTGNTEVKTMMTPDPSSATITGGWNWSYLRSINFFLENFDKADISQEKLDHFEGLARFFRAQFYMGMVKRYSDVPYYDFVIETNDEAALFKARDPRAFVVDRIFEDYSFAADHVIADQPSGAVNKWVVKAYMARAALYEGTFRKYHDELNLQGSASQFLEMARDQAQDIVDSGNFSIYSTGDPESDYSALFTNVDLTSNPEIIYANINITNLKNSGSSATIWGDYEVSASRDLLQAYLMKDGSYYSQQEGYETKQFVEEFVNRDPRLSQTYAAPGFILKRVDTYTTGTGLYVQRLAKNFSGYHQRKGMVNVDDPNMVNDVDIPVLRYTETLLTLAEAKAELGTISQSDLDNTINVIRERAGVPGLTMDVTADPVQQARYPDISDPVLLEIRRERRIELALEGFRFDDLMRWKAGKLLEAEPEGLYFPSLGKYDLTGDGIDDIILIDASETVPGAGEKEQNELGQDLVYYRASEQGGDANVYLKNGNSGTVQTVADRGTFLEPKYYYRPIPQTDVIVNPNLTQIFGWD
ncbi:MAG: RagB/SusD family nutrient uptake outer membrane protein [Saprospiraceae bacterium]|nr:RagB/SusD family nutrient uptake outer membrane protein [Saprospiraceae bacterium]